MCQNVILYKFIGPRLLRVPEIDLFLSCDIRSWGKVSFSKPIKLKETNESDYLNSFGGT